MFFDGFGPNAETLFPAEPDPRYYSRRGLILLDLIQLPSGSGHLDCYLDLYTPYDVEFISAVKLIPGRRAVRDQNGKFLCWRFPCLKDWTYEPIFKLLLEYYDLDEHPVFFRDTGRFQQVVAEHPLFGSLPDKIAQCWDPTPCPMSEIGTVRNPAPAVSAPPKAPVSFPLAVNEKPLAGALQKPAPSSKSSKSKNKPLGDNIEAAVAAASPAADPFSFTAVLGESSERSTESEAKRGPDPLFILFPDD